MPKPRLPHSRLPKNVLDVPKLQVHESPTMGGLHMQLQSRNGQNQTMFLPCLAPSHHGTIRTTRSKRSSRATSKKAL